MEAKKISRIREILLQIQLDDNFKEECLSGITELLLDESFINELSGKGINLLLGELELIIDKDRDKKTSESVVSETSIVEEFVSYLRGKGRSRNIIKSYKSHINIFNEYLIHRNLSLATFNYDHAIYFLLEEGKKITLPSLKRRAAAINTFSEYVGKPLNIKGEDIGGKLKETSSNENQQQVIVLSEESQKRLYKIARISYKKKYLAIMLLILETGIKILELRDIKRSDIDVTKDAIYLNINSNYPRKLPLSKEVYNIILRTIEQSSKSDFVFVNEQGDSLSHRTILHGLNKYGVNSQILRDTFIYNLILNDVDTFEITQLAGLHYTDAIAKKFYSKKIVIKEFFYD